MRLSCASAGCTLKADRREFKVHTYDDDVEQLLSLKSVRIKNAAVAWPLLSGGVLLQLNKGGRCFYLFILILNGTTNISLNLLGTMMTRLSACENCCQHRTVYSGALLQKNELHL